MRILEENAWVFTDPHFQHKKLVEMGKRPEGFEELISTSWIKKDPNAVIYCLGDIAFKAQAETHAQYVQSMPGYKILILGNHDNQKEAWYLSHGWNEVHMKLRLVTKVNGKHTRLLLSHIPQLDDNSFDINVHGHFHNDAHRANTPEMLAIKSKKHKLLALECVNYELIKMQDFLDGKIIQEGLFTL